MKEIVQRLQEKRNIEVAKSILESAGYKITKRLKEYVSISEQQELDLAEATAALIKEYICSEDQREKVSVLESASCAMFSLSVPVVRGTPRSFELLEELFGISKEDLENFLTALEEQEGVYLNGDLEDILTREQVSFRGETIASYNSHIRYGMSPFIGGHMDFSIKIAFDCNKFEEVPSANSHVKTAPPTIDFKKHLKKLKKLMKEADFSAEDYAAEDDYPEETVAENDMMSEMLSADPSRIFFVNEDEFGSGDWSDLYAELMKRSIRHKEIVRTNHSGAEFDLVNLKGIGNILLGDSDGAAFIAFVK